MQRRPLHSTMEAGGCAAALGTRFFRPDGSAFLPTGGTLGEIARLDVSETRRLLKGVRITAMCDVDSPLYGEAGAAWVFAPQKGADLVVSGEGRVDAQSIRGKVISGVARRTRPRGIPLLVIAGGIDSSADAAYELGVTAMFGTDRGAEALAACASRAEENYRRTLEDILRLIRAAEQAGQCKVLVLCMASRSVSAPSRVSRAGTGLF